MKFSDPERTMRHMAKAHSKPKEKKKFDHSFKKYA